MAWQWAPGRRVNLSEEEASGSEGGDASQDQRPLRLQEFEEGVYHHGEAEPPHHRLLGKGCVCRQLLLMPGRRLRPLEAISATIGSERIQRFKLHEEQVFVQL